MPCFSFWDSMNPFNDDPNDETAYPEPQANRTAQAIFLSQNPNVLGQFFGNNRCTRLTQIEKAIQYINKGSRGVSYEHYRNVLLWAKRYQPNLLKEAEKGETLENIGFWTEGTGAGIASVAKTVNNDTFRSISNTYDDVGKTVKNIGGDFIDTIKTYALYTAIGFATAFIGYLFLKPFIARISSKMADKVMK